MFFIDKLYDKYIEKKTKEFDSSGILRYFHYDYGTMTDGITSFSVRDMDGNILLDYLKSSLTDGKETAYSYNIDPVMMSKLKLLLKEEKIFLWNGFSKSNSVIATGMSFNLRGDFDRYHLKADGMTMLPKDFKEKHQVLVNFFEGIMKSSI